MEEQKNGGWPAKEKSPADHKKQGEKSPRTASEEGDHKNIYSDQNRMRKGVSKRRDGSQMVANKADYEARTDGAGPSKVRVRGAYGRHCWTSFLNDESEKDHFEKVFVEGCALTGNGGKRKRGHLLIDARQNARPSPL